MPATKEISDYEVLKAWGGWHNFLLSYGLKPYNKDDVEEGKAILAVIKRNAQEEKAEGSKN
ncbi:unnamed protein product [Somion occarium]|uniref:Uncharacterized protein n=1 Tax=Somion occarium TaxID=3059160 RepID=A0ABP1CLS3_9APHY